MQHFIKRFQREYVPGLQPRSKWKKQTENLAIGSVVTVFDSTSPKYWSLAIVTGVKKGRDDLVRMMTYRLANGREFERDVKYVSVLLKKWIGPANWAAYEMFFLRCAPCVMFFQFLAVDSSYTNMLLHLSDMMSEAGRELFAGRWTGRRLTLHSLANDGQWLHTCWQWPAWWPMTTPISQLKKNLQNVGLLTLWIVFQKILVLRRSGTVIPSGLGGDIPVYYTSGGRDEHRGVQNAQILGGGVQLSLSTAQRCLFHKSVIFFKMRKFSKVHL